VSLTIEEDVPRRQRGILAVGPGGVEAAAEIRWQLAFNGTSGA
jgi:hypothetical protein